MQNLRIVTRILSALKRKKQIKKSVCKQTVWLKEIKERQGFLPVSTAPNSQSLLV